MVPQVWVKIRNGYKSLGVGCHQWQLMQFFPTLLHTTNFVEWS